MKVFYFFLFNVIFWFRHESAFIVSGLCMNKEWYLQNVNRYVPVYGKHLVNGIVSPGVNFW